MGILKGISVKFVNSKNNIKKKLKKDWLKQKLIYI